MLRKGSANIANCIYIFLYLQIDSFSNIILIISSHIFKKSIPSSLYRSVQTYPDHSKFESQEDIRQVKGGRDTRIITNIIKC